MLEDFAINAESTLAIATGLLALATIVLAVAAGVQAWAGHRVANLTKELTRTADQALKASSDQAEAARAALTETRRQGQLELLPYLVVKSASVIYLGFPTEDEPYVEGPPHGLVLALHVANEGSDIALGPLLELRSGVRRGHFGGVVYTQQNPKASVTVGAETRLQCSLEHLKSQSASPIVDEHGKFTRDPLRDEWLEITLVFRNHRGATVRQVYEWTANDEHRSLRISNPELVRIEIVPTAEPTAAVTVNVAAAEDD